MVDAVCAAIGASVVDRGELRHEVALDTRGGFDHGTFRIGEHTAPYLNEYPASSAVDPVAECAVPSGAGHAAAHLARLAPMGMVFVPSVGGRGHCPQELTATEDIARGVHVLAGTPLALDARH